MTPIQVIILIQMKISNLDTDKEKLKQENKQAKIEALKKKSANSKRS